MKQVKDQGKKTACIDLSHTIHNGLPAAIVCDFLSREEPRSRYAPGTEFQIGRIEMTTNTGTNIDCPFHRYADEKDLVNHPQMF